MSYIRLGLSCNVNFFYFVYIMCVVVFVNDFGVFKNIIFLGIVNIDYLMLSGVFVFYEVVYDGKIICVYVLI